LRVAVAGLNPHAGEGGLFGREELDVIAPAIAQARAEGIDARGPFAPDTVFMRARTGEFDVVVAMYHDQGLIPVKYMGVEQGVNVTLGLPMVRTSPDHGTAFDVAGTGRADPSSLLAAIRWAKGAVLRP
jgi:4-hydroxythreonine-4-phosphate dehydrogenase